jgi:hypothetical protein
MSDAVALERLQGMGEPNLSHQIRLSRGGRLYFGTMDSFNNDEEVVGSVPILAKKVGGDWVALPLTDPRLKDAAWAYTGGGPKPGEVWGVLDASLNVNQADLILAHSTDAGATFTISALHKPDEAADFDSFCLGPDGKGRISVYLSAEVSSASAKPGFYHFRTIDGGKTWSSAEYEPDAMSPGRDVPEDDQPTAPEAPARKV